MAADSSRARILQVADREHRLVELQDIVNPEARLADRELITTEHATGLFAKKVAAALDQGRVRHRYERLLLVAPPKFLGRLRKELGKNVAKLVAGEIPKDLSWFSARELEKHIAPENERGR